MASKLPDMSNIERQQQSLLDDASTLLMFSKGRRVTTGTEPVVKKQETNQELYTGGTTEDVTTLRHRQILDSAVRVPLVEDQQKMVTSGALGQLGGTVTTTPPSISRSSFVSPSSPGSVSVSGGSASAYMRSVSDSVYSGNSNGNNHGRLPATVTIIRSPVTIPPPSQPHKPEIIKHTPKGVTQPISSSSKAPTTTVSHSHSPSKISTRDNQSAASVAAAAALTSAASVPLPSRRRSRRVTSETKRTTTTTTTTNSSGTTPKKRQWPVPNTYIVDPDAGIITCICGYSDDDGFTIQCDHCNRWQHAICYGIENVSEVPDHFLCNACQPRRMNIKMAKLRQKRQRELLNLNEPIVGVTYNAGSKKRRKNGSNNNNNHSSPITGTGPSVESIVPSPAGSASNVDCVASGTGVPVTTTTTTRQQTSSTSVSNTASPRTTTTTEKTSETEAGPHEEKREFLVTPVEAHGAVYVPITQLKFKEKVVKLYIERHVRDSCVERTGTNFEELPTEVREYGNGNGDVGAFKGFTKLGLFTKEGCTKGDFIAEVIGEVDLQRNYIADPKNHYRLWGSPKRKVIFHPQWPLVIDQRQCGNSTRYLRRSCHPNVELATIHPANGSVKFVLRAIRDIEKDEELHMNWQWDSRHPILQLINGSKTFDAFDNTTKYTLIHSVDTILGSCECACKKGEDCYLQRVKRIAQELYESVKSDMNDRYKLNEVLAQYQLNRRKREPPILERLVSEANKRRKVPISSLIPSSSLTNSESETGNQTAENDTKTGGTKETESALDQTLTKNKVIPHQLPYKLGLVHNYSLTTSQGYGAGPPILQAIKIPKNHVMNIKDILEYDESKITDLNKLAVPITPPPMATIQHTRGATGPSDASTLSNQAGKQLSQHGGVGSVKDGTSNEIPGVVGSGRQSPMDAATSSSPALITANLRKKLSFADYRKKQQRE